MSKSRVYMLPCVSLRVLRRGFSSARTYMKACLIIAVINKQRTVLICIIMQTSPVRIGAISQYKDDIFDIIPTRLVMSVLAYCPSSMNVDAESFAAVIMRMRCLYAALLAPRRQCDGVCGY